jgi:hypothetical protein
VYARPQRLRVPLAQIMLAGRRVTFRASGGSALPQLRYIGMGHSSQKTCEVTHTDTGQRRVTSISVSDQLTRLTCSLERRSEPETPGKVRELTLLCAEAASLGARKSSHFRRRNHDSPGIPVEHCCFKP